MGRIILAQMVNRVLGGAFVAPWEVDELDDTLLDAIQAVGAGAQARSAWAAQRQAIEAIFARRRAEHPTYRK
ncbi:MAG: hypothetical protein C4570_03435 [Ammonifex sp.]|nr:MAG: hypothetical protein C4570_03435 [Ammonifex sp.]